MCNQTYAAYRVYYNGRCIAFGGYATTRLAFKEKCRAANPFKDVVLFVDHYRKPIDSY